MATIKFYYRSKKESSELTLRFLHRVNNDKDIDIFKKTQYRIDKSIWEETKKKTIKEAHLRNKKIELNTELTKLENFVLSRIPKDHNEINKEWLNETLENYYNPILPDELNEKVIHWIDDFINNAHTFDNSKGGIGLSKSRIATYENLKKQINNFDKKILIKDCDTSTFNKLREWYINEQYSSSTLNKKLSDLRTICKYAQSKGIEVSNQLPTIKIKKGNPYDEDMDVIFLTELEIKKIEKLKLNHLYLINARKWLVLACYTGQRGTALVNQIKQENFKEYGDSYIIRFKQKKGNKTVTIPVLPKVEEIYKNGLPNKISIQKLNDYFKELGKLAKLNDLVIGARREVMRISETKTIQRNVKKERPKWMYLSSHIGRRSFASNHYNKLPTTLIMRVTGHEKESTFLTYINQKNDDHLEVFFDYYKTKKEEPQPKVIELKKSV